MRPIAALIVLLALLALAQAADAQGQTPASLSGQRFKAGAEIVLVDVTVVDEDGAPVADLDAADFTVSVAGKARPIQSVQFMRSAPIPVGPTEATGRDAGVSTNTLPTSGRLLLIAVDEANLRIGASRAVLHAAEALMGRLSPGDLVGLARLPDGGGVEFTTDRSRIVEGLKQVTPRSRRMPSLTVTVYLSEAADFEDRQRIQWPAALVRECGDAGSRAAYLLCKTSMEDEARNLLRDESVKAADTVRVLDSLMRSVAAAQAPVTIVLISESLFLGQDSGVLSGLAATGAASRVSLQVVRPIGAMFDVGDKGFPIDPSMDDALRSRGLEVLASQFRGGFFPVSSTGASAFDRISRELSGYYLLGIEPTNEDRTGRNRRLRVEVKRSGLTVKARPTFIVPASETTAPLDTAQRLQRLLTSPVPTRGLPLKVTTNAVTNGRDAQMRVLIAAEVGDAVQQPRSHHIGVLLLGAKGEVVTSTAGTVSLSPSRAGIASPGLFTTSLVADPGEYFLRVGAIGSDGRTGSVHHNVRATLRPVGDGLAASDLIVAPEPAPGEFPRFNASSVVDGHRVAVVLDVAHGNAGVFEGVAVRFEVASAENGDAIASAEAVSESSAAEKRRSFSQVLSLSTLPAGEYFVRAVVTSGSQPTVTIVRPFRLEPGQATVSEQPFDAAVVRRFIEDLESRYPSSPSLASFIEHAKAATFVAAPAAESRPQADLAMVTFVDGVSALRDGKPALARALLTQTQRAVPGFEGAEYYLRLIK